MWGTKTGREKGMDINMKNTDTKQHLGDVQETALIPLAIRANETERKTARIHDDKAVEIIRNLMLTLKSWISSFPMRALSPGRFCLTKR